MSGLDSIEKGGYLLMFTVVIGVVLVILIGVTYTNYSNNKAQLVTANVAAAIQANYTTNAGNIANTGGSNANYVYYILFAALIIGVVIGVLVGVTKQR